MEKEVEARGEDETGKGRERGRRGEKFNRIVRYSERRGVETPYGIASGEEGYDD